MSIVYRTFRNSDPPHLVDIWRSQPPERALAQPMTVDIFDQLILAKQYFDPHGFIVACDDNTPVGFAHAAFGPSDAGDAVSKTMGVTHLVMTKAHYQRRGIGRELLNRAEDYLRTQGAGVLYAGGVGHLNGFYLGMYGGSELPGVLESSRPAQQLFRSAGYHEIDRVVVLHRETSTFRPPVDRRLMQWRRNASLRLTNDPPPRTWWEACTTGDFAQVRFDVDVKSPAVESAAHLTFWMMETQSAAWGVQTAGLVDLATRPELQRQGLAMFLIGEAIMQLRNYGVSLVETQTMIHNTAALALYKKLGFTEVDHGSVFRKA
ncbi:MAG: GNAT family N-acetyltransferase [Planctomycetales bacterium]|nr:GNAT family N-acetyltransferase [Planctomycetales bacterium]MBN8626358.1 GNAT family N-acetyltransferase [Planctomycetota bacterium]